MRKSRAGGVGPRALAVMAAFVVVAGCATPYIGTTSTSFLHKIRDERDPNIRHVAYDRLADPNCYDDDAQRVEAVRVLSLKLAEGKEPAVTRAVICRTLGEIGRPEAREALLQAIDDPEPVIRSAACRSLGKIGTTEDGIILARVMAADSDPDCRIAAIEGIRNIKKPDPRVEVVLVDVLENPDPAIRLAAYEALQVVTGLDLGPDPKAWKNRSQPLPTGRPERPEIAEPTPRNAEAQTPALTIQERGSTERVPSRPY